MLAITLLAGCSFIMLENTCCTGKNIYGAVARKDIEKNGECKKNTHLDIKYVLPGIGIPL